MNNNHQDMGEYYLLFIKVGGGILHEHFPLSYYEIKDLAHRLVLEFFWSDSFNHTFDSKKGHIRDFFVAWLLLRVQGLRREFAEDRAVVSLESWMSGCLESFDFKYDFESWLLRLFSLLEDKTWVSKIKNQSFVHSYSSLCKAITVQVLNGDTWGNRVNYTKLANVLGVRREDVTKALVGMREIIDGFTKQGVI